MAVQQGGEQPSVRMIVSTVSPKVPSGGTFATFESVNAMARRGHEVVLVHCGFLGSPDDPVLVLKHRVECLEQIDWFRFEPSISHTFISGHGRGSLSLRDLPKGDIFAGYFEGLGRDHGLPIIGIHSLPDVGEPLQFVPCPKMCPSRWVMGVLEERGVPSRQLVYVPNGLDHTKYRLTRPLADRPRQVCLRYSVFGQKGVNAGLEALERVHQRFDDLEVVLFGTDRMHHPLPDWVTYRQNAPQRAIVEEIYNGSQVFVNPSRTEGFGLASVEAMACGCALVTADNGGSSEFAHHDVDALVHDFDDIGRMADHIELLLADDDTRERIATAGTAEVQRLDWDRSAVLMEAFLERYLADPDHYA